jgi:FkbM family methyltransferase
VIQHQGIYLPDGERHLQEWMDKEGEIVDGRGSYQIKKLRKALVYCDSFRNAVDIGAHVGFWTMQMAKQFERVYSFEPVARHRECFHHNCLGLDNVELNACALGEKLGMIQISSNPTSSGDSRVDGEGTIPMKTLDSFNLQNVDFVKIDTEGYELYAIRGGEETIKRCRPIMVVEQKGHGMKYFGFRKEQAVELLISWGMRPMREHMSGDWVMGW